MNEKLLQWAKVIGGSVCVGLFLVALTLGPKLALDAWFSWHWQERLAEIRAPYEFENRETMFKLCTTFLEWEVKYGDAQPIKGMDVICVPEIPPKMPIRLQSPKKQDRLK